MAGNEVTLVPPTPPGMEPRPQAWPWVVGGGCVLGCALLIGLAVAGIGLGAHSLVNRLQHGGFSCLPSDFPSYPGSSFGGENYTLNGPTPGNVCQMVFETNDVAGNVFDFYQSSLSSGDWEVVSTAPNGDELTFQSTKTSTTSGSLTVASKGDHTEITIQMYSGYSPPTT